MATRFVVYVHPAQTKSPTGLLGPILGDWEERGAETILLDDPGRVVDADLAFVHVDATFLPPEYRTLSAHYPLVVNGRRPDVPKRSFSTQLVGRESDHDGRVIVKTNLNARGVADNLVHRRPLVMRTLVRNLMRRFLPDTFHGGALDGWYHVYDSVAAVPPLVWRLADHFVVEKFIPEIKNSHYLIRHYYFLGDHGIAVWRTADYEIVRGRNTVDWGYMDDVPAALADRCDALRLEYGKIDFVVHNGEPIILDVNPTPGASPVVLKTETRVVPTLSKGIADLLEKVRS